jgi:uncharacterized UBP type Zn finger protein
LKIFERLFNLKIQDFEAEKEKNTKQGIVDIDETVLNTLLSMGIAENHARKALEKTSNGTIDQIFEYIEKHENDVEFNKPLPSVSNDINKKKKKKPRYIPLELQKLFSQLQLIDTQAVSTQGLFNFIIIIFVNLLTLFCY